ncbi:DUF3499 domain-containing protein [Kocuria sp. cx-116]|uniref:DUF3499 domain-containing protein n=1 Tax=Kocuria sp. cx-116 TaxID=2771378 RepID=UPI0016853989|nr:DUF3499 domain-containing protein [Kocuria sp. cx-116]MBD2762740.1 DUF3499 domain-containing protein [Kocuria sp. cx-116]
MNDELPQRTCSRQTCSRAAMCTLTYVYSDSTAVIGALSARSEPHAYDLCAFHADRMTAPRGWRVVRLESPDGWNRDDLGAVVEAVRDDEQPAARRRSPSPQRPGMRAPGRLLRDVSFNRTPVETPGNERTADDSETTPQAAPDFTSAPMPPSLRRPHLRRP